MKFRIGTCGWKRFYQAIPPSKREGITLLEAYAKFFPVVEINSSYYTFHKLKTYKKWRNQTPEKFEFTLKCHKNITHKERLKPTEDAIDDFSKIVKAAQACDVRVILVQTPASLEPSKDTFKSVDKFFEKIEQEKVQLVWETRGKAWSDENARKKLKEILNRHEISHVTDILKKSPVTLSNIAYFRLHGTPGYNLKHKYTNDELYQLYDRITEFEKAVDRIYVFFNNYTMYKDAQRLLHLHEHDELPQSPLGFRSIPDTLSTYEKWPTTKEQLMDDCGSWYVWIAPNNSVRLRELLKYFEAKEYSDLNEILEESKRIWGEISEGLN